MENAKQKAIEVAYGEYYNNFCQFIDDNGWLQKFKIGHEQMMQIIQLTNNIECESKINSAHEIRPKSLAGIETNNNWISIHSEDDLPTDISKFYKVGKMVNNKFYLSNGDFDAEEVEYSFLHDKMTHYQTIIKPKSPIY